MKEYRSTISRPIDSNEDELLEYCNFSREYGYTREDFRGALNSLLHLAEELEARYLMYTLSSAGRLPSFRLECIRRRFSAEKVYDIFLNFKYLRSVTMP